MVKGTKYRPETVDGFTFLTKTEKARYTKLPPAERGYFIDFAKKYVAAGKERGRAGIDLWNAWLEFRSAPDPTEYEWLEEEFEEWKCLEPYDLLPYVKFAMDQKENHGIEWQEGWMTLQEWKKMGSEAKLDLMERWGARTWLPPVLSNFTDGDFKIKEYEGSDTETVSVASSDAEWGLEPSQRDKIKKEAPGAPGKNYDWKYVKTLYRRGPDPVTKSSKDDGFSSINCLYIGFDEDGIAQEHLVAKYSEWYRSELGLRDRNAFYEGNRIIKEDLPNRPHILPLRGVVTFDNRRTDEHTYCGLITYMDFCPASCLGDLLRKYGNRADKRQIPESFIWLVFLNVAEALYLFHTGLEYNEEHDKDDKAPGWVEILHRDLKPPNIFLNVGQDPFMFYPFPQVADFDYCVRLNDTTARKRHIGTRYWRAPEAAFEHTEDRAGNKIDTKPLISAKSDIFVLGLIIKSLIYANLSAITRRTVDDQIERHARTYSSGIAGRHPQAYDNMYSEQLIELLERCLAIDPKGRPTAWELVTEAKHYMQRWIDTNGLYKDEAEREVDERWKLDFTDGAKQFPIGRRYDVKRRQREEDDDEDDGDDGDDGDNEDDGDDGDDGKKGKGKGKARPPEKRPRPE